MNGNWIRRDRKGVSPVIATILMVAITVVLAAVLYLMVSYFIMDPPKTQSGSITLGMLDESRMEVRFGTFKPDPKVQEVRILIENGTARSSYLYSTAAGAFVLEGLDNAGTGPTVAFDDLTANEELDNGDSLVVPVQRGCKYTVKVVMNDASVCQATLDT